MRSIYSITVGFDGHYRAGSNISNNIDINGLELANRQSQEKILTKMQQFCEDAGKCDMAALDTLSSLNKEYESTNSDASQLNDHLMDIEEMDPVCVSNNKTSRLKLNTALMGIVNKMGGIIEIRLVPGMYPSLEIWMSNEFYTIVQ